MVPLDALCVLQTFFTLVGNSEGKSERITGIRRLDVMMSPVAAYTAMLISIEACGLSIVTQVSTVH